MQDGRQSYKQRENVYVCEEENAACQYGIQSGVGMKTNEKESCFCLKCCADYDEGIDMNMDQINWNKRLHAIAE